MEYTGIIIRVSRGATPIILAFRFVRFGGLSRAVEGDEDEGGCEEGGGEVEGGGEAGGGDHGREQQRARAGAGVEGGVPQGATEAVLGLLDAAHDEDEGGVLQQAEAGPEEQGSHEQDGALLDNRGDAYGAGEQAGGEEEARVVAVAEAPGEKAAGGAGEA